MVEQFVRDFVPAAMALGLDFTRMERVNAKFHGRGGRRREGDVIWRVPTECGGDVYLYLMLEFQSQIDWWMPIRIQVYAGLLWQQIIDEMRLKPGDRLPPVLPVVLYNGDRVWNAPTGTTELVALVDEIIGWFRQQPDYETLKQLFTEIVGYALSEQAGFANEQTALPANDLLEIRDMVPERFKRWADEVRADAEAKALANALSRQLGRRFGTLPPDMTERIRSAKAEELNEWMDRVVDAASVSDVFDDKRVN